MKGLLAAAIIVAIFTGCATKTGNDIIGGLSYPEIDSMIADGEGTKRDVAVKFGTPDYIETDDAGNEHWRYIYIEKSGSSSIKTTRKVLDVYFDKNSNVRAYRIDAPSTPKRLQIGAE